MAVNEKITCDICGVQKGEANHWMLWTTEFFVPGPRGEIGGVRFAPWHKDLYRDYNHLCGESCAGKLLAKSVAEWREIAELSRCIPSGESHDSKVMTARSH